MAMKPWVSVVTLIERRDTEINTEIAELDTKIERLGIKVGTGFKDLSSEFKDMKRPFVVEDAPAWAPKLRFRSRNPTLTGYPVGFNRNPTLTDRQQAQLSATHQTAAEALTG
ncbi:MAG: hypothetical protein OXI96_07015 [Acidimicrobiaceae bacterium]|nr:hypothetical protein [Acidimicrobiaceae bacterium]